MGLMSSATRQRCRSVAGRLRRQGKKTAFLSFGSVLSAVETVAEHFNATVADMRFVKPLDEALIFRLADEHDYLITAEENVIAGGGGSAVSELLDAQNIHKPILHLVYRIALWNMARPPNCWPNAA